MNDEMAGCSRCQIVKPGSDFYRNKRTLSGLNAWCKDCMKARQKERYRDDAQFRERQIASAKRWDSDNPEIKRERMAQYQCDNRDRVNAQVRERYRRNPFPRLHSGEMRRARQARASIVPFTEAQLAQRWAYYGGKCWMCKTAPATATDHVKPLAKGGAHILANLRPACQACNSSKKDRWPVQISQLPI